VPVEEDALLRCLARRRLVGRLRSRCSYTIAHGGEVPSGEADDEEAKAVSPKRRRPRRGGFTGRESEEEEAALGEETSREWVTRRHDLFLRFLILQQP
jgi:hypothetical protein